MKLIHPSIAVLAFSLAGALPARAEATAPTAADAQTPAKPKKVKKQTNRAQFEKAESGSPHSVLYKPGEKGAPNPTAEQIKAGESESPASVDYPNRKAATHKPTNEEITEGEKVSPAVAPSRP
jgi:hypothetical protein